MKKTQYKCVMLLSIGKWLTTRKTENVFLFKDMKGAFQLK